jgi:hypothetical protein
LLNSKAIVVQYTVPILSWVLCILFSFIFTVWLAFADDTGGNYTNAHAWPFVWGALPALVIGFSLLLGNKRRLKWLAWGFCAFPWCIYPWIAAAFPATTYGPPPERSEWLHLAMFLGCIFLAFSIIAVTVHGYYSRHSPHPANS